MTAKEKITRAKVQLILSAPFFATISMGMQYIEDTTLETSEVNGVDIKYNPKFIDGLDIDECKGWLAKSALHVGMLHHTRRAGRDMVQWRKSCDYAINPLIVKSGFKLPQGHLMNEKYNDMSAEQIFKLLPGEKPGEKPKGNQPGQGDNQGKQPDPGKCGTVGDSPAKSAAEVQQVEAQTKQILSQAAAAAKKQGKLPGHLERLIEEVLQPKVNWKEALARFLTDTEKNDYTFRKPNPRYLQTGFFLPALESETIGEWYLFVDTSGSIDGELLDQFAGEMQDIINTFGKGFTVLYVDAKFQGIQEIEPDDTIKLKPKGGGGTDFRPGFTWLEENSIYPAGVVYFTDGECYRFPEPEPDFPVLWAKYGSTNFEPPFGEVIEIDE